MGAVRKGKRAADKAALDASVKRSRQLHQEAEKYAIDEVAKVFETLIDGKFHRPVSSLTRHELGQITFGAISAWIVKRAEQAKALDENVDDLIDEIKIGI